MNKIVNQFRRIFADNGRGDKDFTDQEAWLREAQQELHVASEALSRASKLLTDTITARA